MSAFDSFVEAICGSVGGFVSATVLFPLDAIKTRMQAGAKGSYLDIAKDIMAKDGVLALWSGCHYVGFSSSTEKLLYFYVRASHQLYIKRADLFVPLSFRSTPLLETSSSASCGQLTRSPT